MQKVPDAFHESVLRDPLFSAEGMDIDAARKALITIQKNIRQLEEALSGTHWLSMRFWLYRAFFTIVPLNGYAFPLSFLQACIASEEKRRAYLAHPAYESARELLAAWNTSARGYERSLLRYRFLHRVVLWLEPKARDYVLQDLFGNISTIPHIERTLAHMTQNAEQLHEEVSLRRRMFEGARGTITDPVFDAPDITTGALDPLYARLHTYEIARGITPFRQSVIEDTYGPFSYALKNFEGTATPHTFMLYTLRNKETHLRSMWVAVVDRYLLTKVWDPSASSFGQSGKVPFVFSGGLTAEDTPYWYEPAGHLYVSRDPSYWMDIAAHADMLRRPALDPRLVQAEKSSLLHLLLGACSDDLRTFVRHTRRRERTGTLSSYSLVYGLLMRTHPALYFLTFNRSVWRLPEQPQFLGERWKASIESPYVPESEVHSISDDDLARVMSAQALREQREHAAGFFD